MTSHEIAVSIVKKLTPAHLQVLEVCQEFAKTGDGAFCGEWIMHSCQQKGISFHQGWLTKMANVGLLLKDDSSRRGHRRYYQIKDAELVRNVLGLAVPTSPY
jgi:hypothetical protein